MASSREQLVDLLDRKVFDPILRRSADDYDSEREKDEYEDLRRSTESEKERFHKEYTSAEEVKDNYHSDLSSSANKKKDLEAEDLGLPRRSDIREEFDQLCEKLGV